MRRTIALVSVIATVQWVGCSRGTSGGSYHSVPPGSVVARVGSDIITAEVVEARLRDRFRTGDPAQQRERIIGELIRDVLLSQEAKERGFDQEPIVQASVRRLLAQDFSRRLALESRSAEPTDLELDAYLNDHRSEFDQPERVRVQQLFVSCQTESDPGCVKGRSKSENIVARLRANERRATSGKAAKGFQPGLFAKIAATESEEPAASSQLGFSTHSELAVRFSPEFADAAFRLQNPGDMTPPIPVPGGLRIARLVRKESESKAVISDPHVREAIRSRLGATSRSSLTDQLVSQLRKKVHVDVDRVTLDAIEIPMPKIVPATRNIPAELKTGTTH